MRPTDQSTPPPVRGLLARLMDPHGSSEGLWAPEELSSILRYRLSLPVERPRVEGDAPSSALWDDAEAGLTYAQALEHPRPSLELLRGVLAFCEAGRRDPESGLPPEVATLLYYAGAAAGLVRHGQRLVPFEDDTLLRGLKWASRQTWADESCRASCEAALHVLHSSGIQAGSEDDVEIASDDLPPLGESLSADDTPAAPAVEGYEISTLLGEGGMGTVWRAVQLSTRRPVALKVVPATAVGSHRARQRFEREVELAAKLEHPGVARVYDSGTSGGHFYYAMELVEGVHVDQYVRAHALAREDMLRLMREVCLAVHHAHQRGVIHRDLKPANVMVTESGQPKVLDFGLAKAADGGRGVGDLTLTQDGHFAGTPAFMSPEQAVSHSDRLDVRTDVYSLGATLYVLLTAHHPHDMSGPRYEVLRRVAQDDARPPRQFKKEVDAELEALLLKALARDPERRYGSAAELAQDIDNYLQRRPLTARAPTAGYVLWKWARRHRLRASAAAAVLLLLLTTAGFFYQREVRQRVEAELNLATGKLAEGDALIPADEIGQAVERYEEARQLLEKNGASTSVADLYLWRAYRFSPPPLMEYVGHTAQINCAAFLPGGRILTGAEDGTARVWDALTGLTTQVWKDLGQVQRMSLSPDGKSVAFAGMGRGVTICDVDTGMSQRVITAFDGEAIAVAYSPDGKRLAVGTTDRNRNTYLFDINGKLIRTFEGTQSAVCVVAFSPDGRTLYARGGRAPHVQSEVNVDIGVRAWDVEGGEAPWGDNDSFIAGQQYTSEMALSPDGASLVHRYQPGSVLRRHAATGELRSSMGEAGMDVTGLAFSPEGALLAIADNNGRIELRWSSSMGRVSYDRGRTILFGGKRAVCFSPDGRLLAAAQENVLRVWPLLETAAQRGLIVEGRQLQETAASLSSDGTLAILTDHARLRVRGGVRAVRVHDVRTGRLLQLLASGGLPDRPGEAADEHDAFAIFVPKTDWILLIEESGVVGIYDHLQVGDIPPLRRLEAWGNHQPAGLAASPNGKMACVRFWGTDELQLYDLSTGRRRRLANSLRLDGAVTIDRMVFSPDSTRVAACSREGVVKIWDVETGDEVLNGQTASSWRVAWSPDGKLLASVGQGLKVWDARTGEVICDLAWPDMLGAVTFLPDGRHVAMGGGTKMVIVDAFTREARWFSFFGSFAFDLVMSKDRRSLLIAKTVEDRSGVIADLSFAASIRRWQAEMPLLKQRLEKDGEDPGALRALGEWYALRGAWGPAAELLEKADARRAGVDPILLEQCHWMNGSIAKSDAALKAAATQSPVGAGRLYLKSLQTLHEEASPVPPGGKSGDEPLLKMPLLSHPYYALYRRMSRKPPAPNDRQAEAAPSLEEADALLMAATRQIPNRSVAEYLLEDVRANGDPKAHATIEKRTGRTSWGPHRVPGLIEAEDFDAGGEGVASHDNDQEDQGSAQPHYREGAVDIDFCADNGGGYNVGGIEAREWLNYTLDVTEDGEYDLDFRVASRKSGTFHVEFDGHDATGLLKAPNTGGWQKWVTVTKSGIHLTRGKRRMRVMFDAPDDNDNPAICNLNWIQLRKSAVPLTAPSGVR
jgi:serine/threonine protein kinase/WD40 repeat protein